MPSATEAELAPWQVWWVDFDPQFGREQAGIRPAVVVSSGLGCRVRNGLVYVAPCTTRIRGLDINPGVRLVQASAVLLDQVKAIDLRRIVRRHPAVLAGPEIDTLRTVLRRLLAI